MNIIEKPIPSQEMTVKIDMELTDEQKLKFEALQKQFEVTAGFKPTTEQLFLYLLNTTHRVCIGAAMGQSPFMVQNQNVPNWAIPQPNTFERNK
jgi:hypothetical protein